MSNKIHEKSNAKELEKYIEIKRLYEETLLKNRRIEFNSKKDKGLSL